MMIDELEADHCAPARSGYAIIAAPHPLMGGRLDNPVVEALADGFEREGLGTLRFNYRGVGESAGTASADVARAAEDYARVLAWLRARPDAQGGALYFAGYSFGAIAAIHAALRDDRALVPSVSALVLVAPPLGMLAAQDLSRAALPSFVLSGAHDDFAPIDRARSLYKEVERCTFTELQADHFFAYELDAVADFARTAVAPIQR